MGKIDFCLELIWRIQICHTDLVEKGCSMNYVETSIDPLAQAGEAVMNYMKGHESAG
jgi:hypothetical protein